MSLNWAFQALELSSFLSLPGAKSCPVLLRCMEGMHTRGVAQGISVTCRSTQQQTLLKVASAYGKINPTSVHVRSPALQAHTSVSEGSQVQSQVKTGDSFSLTEHCPRRPPETCMPCSLSNLRLCSPDRSHRKSSHPKQGAGSAQLWELSVVLSGLEPVWGYNVSQPLVRGGTGIPEHVTAPSTGWHPTASPS